MTKKAVIYCRVSSKRQVEEGNGIESQELMCLQLAVRRGYEIVQIYKEPGVSAKDADRPAFKEMMSFLKRAKEPFYILAYSQSRLFRDAGDFFSYTKIFDSYDIMTDYVTVDLNSIESSNVKFLVSGITAVQDQYHRLENETKVRNNMEACLYAGRWILKPPLGYTMKKLDKSKTIVRDEPLATHLKKAFEGYANGSFHSRIEAFEFIKSKGFDFDVKRFYEAIKKPIYAGYFDFPVWKIPLTKAIHEPIITLETHNKILSRINMETKTYTKDLNQEFPLRRIVKCSECNKFFTASFAKSKSNKKFPYYYCANKECVNYSKMIAREKLEHEFIKLLENNKPSESIIKAYEKIFENYINANIKNLQNDQQEAKAKLVGINKQISNTVDKSINIENNILFKAFENKLTELQIQKATLEEKITTIKLQLNSPSKKNFRTPLKKFLEDVLNVVDNWHNGDLATKRLIVKTNFSGDIVYDPNSGFRTPEKSSIYLGLEAIFTTKNYYGGP